VGLTVREAMRRLTQRAVTVRISGSGVVTRQEPAPGTRLPLNGPCRLWCSPREAAAAQVSAPGSDPSPLLAARVRHP
jgi:hypothetical protein